MLLLLATASAQYASTPHEVLFEDLLTPFTGSVIDTGYLPDPNGAIAVRFFVTPSGGVFTEMEAVSDLRWPNAFFHSMTAIPGEGLFGIDVDLDIALEVQIDVAVYQDTFQVFAQHLTIEDVVAFDTLVLPDSPEYPLEVAAEANLLDPFEFDIGLITGVSLDLAVDIEPVVAAQLYGKHVESSLAGVSGQQTEELGSAVIGVPAGNPAIVDVESAYVADLASQVQLAIVPSATLDTFIGDFQLIAFDLPIDILDFDEERRFDPVFSPHPLPAMQPFEVDPFGEVELGNLANRSISLVNLGLLGLEGVARIEGNDVFTVFPDYFYATADQDDGLVVTFMPETIGAAGATLVIESNDPSTPELRVPLQGVGFEEVLPPTEPPTPPSVDQPEPPESINGEDVKGCGCSSGRDVSGFFGRLLRR